MYIFYCTCMKEDTALPFLSGLHILLSNMHSPNKQRFNFRIIRDRKAINTDQWTEELLKETLAWGCFPNHRVQESHKSFLFANLHSDVALWRSVESRVQGLLLDFLNITAYYEAAEMKFLLSNSENVFSIN